MLAVRREIDRSRGQVYNLGGGCKRAISIIEMIKLIEQKTGCSPKLAFKEVRPGDQPLYISDTSKLERHTGWKPRRSIAETLQSIYSFWKSQQLSFDIHPASKILHEEVA
jgi:CDP-paratose 2-epimerase